MTKKQQKKKTILFLGDSISDNAFNRRTKHLHSNPAYPAQFARAHKEFNCICKGIASNRSYHVYDRLTKDCIALCPDIVVLLIGVNDAWEHYVPEQYPPLLRDFQPHFAEIMRRLNSELPHTKVVIMTPFLVSAIAEKMPFRAFLAPYVDFIKAQAQRYGFPIIDLQSVFDAAEKQHAPVELASDGVHPTVLGHHYICKCVENAVLSK
ncbi:MAG: GDSL-type esterase/lipase family protein [Clostridia bacterium]